MLGWVWVQHCQAGCQKSQGLLVSSGEVALSFSSHPRAARADRGDGGAAQAVNIADKVST